MDVYSNSILSLDGQPISFQHYQNKVLLLFNSASHCGFTPQLAQLTQLHEQYHQQGLVIIGFPCNQFRQQEPDSHIEIANFCQKNYGVPFLMTEKINVNGAQAHPLWQQLQQAKPGILGTQRIKWNFTKFLIGKNGQVLARKAPYVNPLSMQHDIEKALSC